MTPITIEKGVVIVEFSGPVKTPICLVDYTFKNAAGKTVTVKRQSISEGFGCFAKRMGEYKKCAENPPPQDWKVYYDRHDCTRCHVMIGE